MTNEVIGETEDANQSDASVIDEKKEGIAAETAADETPNETPVEETAIEPETISTTVSKAAKPEDSDEPPSSGDVDFGAILEKFEQDQTIYHSGELVNGKVVGVSDRGVLIDFGYKSEGAVPLEEFTSPEGEVTIKEGDEVEVVIRNIHTGDGPPMLSRNDALRRKTWDEIEKAFDAEIPIKGFVTDKTKGGLKVDINGIEAFLPGSQIDSRPFSNLDSYIGKEIEAKVIKFSRRRNNLVLSRKVLTDEVVNKQKAETLKNIEEGFIVEGTVKNLTPYGAFVDIGGIDGLLHISDMSWERTPAHNNLFKIGDNIQVKVLKLDREREKVGLGYKQLIPDPWQTVPEIYPVGSKINGKVSSATDYGIFVELESGIEGLVHVSEMSWSKRSVIPRKMVRPGQEIEVQVLGIDTQDHRISLGMKQLQPNPWDTISERFHVGDRIRGKVRNITDFGAFVEIEEGIDGLVHVSDITWSKKVRYPKDLLEKDQEVDAIITSVDAGAQRMSLSMKDIAPSEWESFIATHKTGDVVRGKVTRFAGFGVFAELSGELEGLCHISELADERVERPEDVVQIGQEMDFKILRIDHEEQKIGLSARAVGYEKDSAEGRSYSTEAKGGMASLGELMKLKRGNAPEEEVKEEPKLSKKERKALKMQEKAAAAEVSESEAATETPDSTETEVAPVEAAETADEAPAAEETEAIDAESPAAEEKAETEGVAEENVEAEVKAEAETEKSEIVAEEKAETEAVTEENADTEAEAKTEVETETSEIVAEEKAETEAVTEENAETEAEAKTEVETETSEAVAEEEPETETEAAVEAETETSEVVAEEKSETDAETSDAPLLTDIEGEAESAPDDTTPRDEIAEEAAKGETESSETSEESEEKTAGK